jgi:hypothetical protein
LIVGKVVDVVVDVVVVEVLVGNEVDVVEFCDATCCGSVVDETPVGTEFTGTMLDCVGVTEIGVEFGTVVEVETTWGVAIVTDVAVAEAIGPVFVTASRTELADNWETTVPSLLHVTVTTTETFAADDAGENVHPVAVPVLEKSPAAMPETDSEKVTV